jgi:uncharacterized protein (TIGR03435 family)
MMHQWNARSLSFSSRMSLNLAGSVAMMALVVFGMAPINEARAQATAPAPAQAATPAPAQGIADTWQGTLHAGQDLRIVLKATKAADGSYKADFYSIDQGGQPIPVTKITLDGATVKMSLTMIGGTYEGKLSGDGKTIEGTWTQGSNPLPLIFARTTPATEWAIPKPPPPIPPMAADANPSFEVATIKPTKPDEQRRFLIWNGRRMETVNTTLGFLISFAYGLHAKQLIGLPAWADTAKFDITGQPDTEGRPSDKQLKGMVQKLLAERFKLTFHQDKRELSVYVLSVTKTGQKLTKSEGDPNGLPGLFFQGLGKLNVRNATMKDFTGLMQNAVLDRPVVDQTELAGRFDFTLNWTPDDSQFGGMGAKIPPPTDSADAPPNLYTAIQEQIGLKLEATKAPADVLVIDHVEEPSAN